jgi:hypothetical protein
MKKLIFVLAAVFTLSCSALAAGKLLVLLPANDFSIYVDGGSVYQTGQKLELLLDEGQHMIKINDRKSNTVYDDLVNIKLGEVATINITPEPEAKIEKPAAVATVPTQKEVGNDKWKKLIIRPIYYGMNTVNQNVLCSNFMGQQLIAKYNIDERVDPAMGLAAEAVVIGGGNIEWIMGISYTNREIRSYSGKGKLENSADVTYKDVRVNTQMTQGSFYNKIRLIGGELTKDSINPYFGLKIGVSSLTFSGEQIVGDAFMGDAGVLIGLVIDDVSDLEISYEYMQGSTFNFDDGNDIFNGIVTIPGTLSISYGFRF